MSRTRLARFRPRKRTVFLLPMMFPPQPASALDRSEKQIVRDPIDYGMIWGVDPENAPQTRDTTDASDRPDTTSTRPRGIEPELPRTRPPFGVWERSPEVDPRLTNFPNNRPAAFVVSTGTGLLTGASFMILGGFLGGVATSGVPCSYICIPPGLILGGVIGEIVGVATGAHLGNRRRGDLGLNLMTSLVSPFAAGAALNELGDDKTFQHAILAQLLATSLVEVLASDYGAEADSARAARRKPRPKHRPFGVWERTPRQEPAVPEIPAVPDSTRARPETIH